jgi:hypothetical protein
MTHGSNINILAREAARDGVIDEDAFFERHGVPCDYCGETHLDRGEALRCCSGRFEAPRVCTDGGTEGPLDLTKLPYQCRNCGTEHELYATAETIAGERFIDAHNARLTDFRCPDCDCQRVFVLATAEADAARDGHPIQAVVDLEAKRQGQPLRADGGVVESDMEAWIAAGCPEPVAADKAVGDADCDFECDREAEYRVQFDNGHITLCCQSCSIRNRLYAKENDLLENEVREADTDDGGQR